jgi:hypothetical protein
MLEVLTDIIPIYGRGEVRPIHRPAKRLQRTLGDLRDLERFSRSGPPPEAAEPSGHRPPGFRRQNKKLLEAAVVAYRSLKQARVPASLT